MTSEQTIRQNSGETWNFQQQRTNSAARLEITRPAENCGP